MELFTVWYIIIGVAYSLLMAIRCQHYKQNVLRDVYVSLFAGLFWPWSMLSIEFKWGARR